MKFKALIMAPVILMAACSEHRAEQFQYTAANALVVAEVTAKQYADGDLVVKPKADVLAQIKKYDDLAEDAIMTLNKKAAAGQEITGAEELAAQKAVTLLTAYLASQGIKAAE